jgi:hypothetical protein
VSDLKRLIDRQIKRRMPRIRGTCVTDPFQTNFDPGGARFLHFVVDVDIGSGRILEKVPVKIAAKARFYARAGQPVFLDRDGQGRYQVTAPADRVQKQGSITTLDEDAATTAAGGAIGFSTTREVFDFYKGTTPESFFDPALEPDNILWLRGYDRLAGLPENIFPVTDADGAEVVLMIDKSGSGNNAASTGVATENPLYRRFDGAGGNTNLRSAVDFDGSNDVLDIAANVTESIGGQISIFLLLNKDAAGAGNDFALQLANWDILSRRSAGDSWGFDQGGGVVDSGSTLSAFVLIELVATSFANIDLYQNGTLLGNFTPGGAGAGNATSHLGNDSAGVSAHNGRIAEVLVIDETVSAAKRANIEAYFNQTMFVSFALWRNGVDGFPKILTLDAAGNEVVL